MSPVYRKGARASIFLMVLLGLSSCARCSSPSGEIASKGRNAFQLVTGEDSEQDRTQWDALYDRESYVFGKEPSEALRKFVDVLPVGRALDIAMGEGRNAVFLAKKGFVVDGVDISEVALRKANRLARENGVDLRTVNADLGTYQIPSDTYEVIVNVQYLQRSLVPQIKRGLKRGGVVIFENQTEDQLLLSGHEGLRRDTLLKKGELRELFKEFKVLHYREWTENNQALAQIVAVKP